MRVITRVPETRTRHKPTVVIVFSTETTDTTELPCSQCHVKVIIPAELLDVVAPEDFICLPCSEGSDEEEEKE